MKEIKMNVTGIMCNNCVNKINAAISDAEGCESSVVSGDFSAVSVKFHEDQISANQIAGILEGIEGKSFQVKKMEEILK